MSAAKRKKSLAEMSFFDHLDELRGVLIRAILGVVVALFICYYFAPKLQDLLLIPFRDQSSASLALLAPAEGFIVRLKISLVAAIFLSAPWTFFQLWSFVAPGLFKHERKLVVPVVFFSTALFLLGAAFAGVVLPMAVSFFLGFATTDVQNAWSLGKYVDFTLRLFLAFGVVFELPLLIYFLARFGVVTPAFLRTYRRHMYVVFLVGASIITPPDVFTQLMLCIPLVVLYEASILLSVVAMRKHERAMASVSDEGSSSGGGSGAEEDPSSGGGSGGGKGTGESTGEPDDSGDEAPGKPGPGENAVTDVIKQQGDRSEKTDQPETKPEDGEDPDSLAHADAARRAGESMSQRWGGGH